MVTSRLTPPHPNLELNLKRVISYQLPWHNSWESSDKTNWHLTSVSKPVPMPQAMCVLLDGGGGVAGTDSVSLEWEKIPPESRGRSVGEELFPEGKSECC